MRKEAKVLEQRLETLSTEKASLDEKLADPQLYGEDRWEELKPLLERKSEVESAIEEVETAWLEAIEKLEQST